MATPDDERHRLAFKPRAQQAYRSTTGYAGPNKAGNKIVAIGKAAGVKVNTSGKLKHASAHDLRRSFGEHWAARVMPQVLMELMRHDDDLLRRSKCRADGNVKAELLSLVRKLVGDDALQQALNGDPSQPAHG